MSDHRRWVATLSHEINQPLAVALSKLEIIEEEIKDREISNFGILAVASEVKGGLVEVSEMLIAILKKASDSSGAINIKLAWVKLHDVLNGVMEHIGLSSSDLNSMLIDDSSLLADLYVYTDQYLLKRVIRNFIENSIKYSPSGSGGIFLFIKRKGGRLSLVVTNKISRSKLPETRLDVLKRDSELRLGLGFGVGSGFVRIMSKALPGQKIGFKIFRQTFAVAKIEFKVGFCSVGPPRDVRLRTYDRISLFSDNTVFVNFIAADVASRGLRLDVYGLSELSRQIGFESSAAAQLSESIFVVEVCQNLSSARDFFGDNLYEVVCDFGRFIFVSEAPLDTSFNDLGLVVESLDDIPLFFNGIFNN